MQKDITVGEHMFSSRSFIVTSLAFRSLIHVELIFVFAVRDGRCWFHSSTSSHPVFPAPVIEQTVFSALNVLASFVVD